MSIPLLKIPLKGYIKQGDTISKKTITLGGDWSGDLTENHVIRMQIYDGSIKIINISSKVGVGGITITGASSFEIDEVVSNDFTVGCFVGDLQIEEYDGVEDDPINITTYFNIQYTIIKEYTKIP